MPAVNSLANTSASIAVYLMNAGNAYAEMTDLPLNEPNHLTPVFWNTWTANLA